MSMKKNVLFIALVALFSFVVASCSSDDNQEEKTDYPVNLNTPTNAENTVLYELPVALAPTTESNLQLKSLDITESGKIIVELRYSDTQKPVYVMGNVSKNGNTYTVSGDKLNGTIQMASANARTTRSSNSSLVINLTITLEEVVSYVTEDGETVEAVVTQTIDSSDEAMNRLARTWNILGAIVDIKGDNIKAYEEFESRNGVFDLKDILDEAVQQGISVSDDDRAALEKRIKNVTLTKSQKFILTYVDGGEDVAEWEWANSEKTRIKINLKDDSMGNLFLNDDSKLFISFRDNRCNIRLETIITDNNGKRWDGTLTMKLQSVD